MSRIFWRRIFCFIHKGMLCFMIVGLKSNVPFMIKALPETENNGNFLHDNLLECMHILHQLNFNIREIVHSKERFCLKDTPFALNGKRIYLIYDNVYLMKNSRNNLMDYKCFLFPPFLFEEFYYSVYMSAGEFS